MEIRSSIGKINFLSPINQLMFWSEILVFEFILIDQFIQQGCKSIVAKNRIV